MITFIFPRRLHRLAYFIRGLIFDTIAGFLYSLGTTMNARIWWALVIILTIYGMFFIILPRIRDIGMSGWWVLAMLIPIADAVFGIILLFRAPMSVSEGLKSLPPTPGGASVSSPHLSPGVAEL
jgi:uncharacterized membrane protein YhaH (DUF805 family)